MRRRRAIALVVAAGVLLPAALAARRWSLRHQAEVAPQAEGFACLDCHRIGGGPALRSADVHPDPSALAVSPDGRTAFVACGPAKSLAVLDVPSARVVATIGLGGRPRGVAVSPDGATVAVTLTDANRVALLDPRERRVVAEVGVGAEPAGAAFGAGGSALFVANAGSHDVSVIDVAARRETRRLATGQEPYAVAATRDGATVAVVARRAHLDRPENPPRSEVTFVDAATGRVARRVDLPSCHLSEAAAFTHDGARLLVPTLRVRNLLPILQVARGWVMSAALATVDPATGDVALLPLQEPDRGFPDPSAIALSSDGRRAFVAAGGSDEIVEIDVAALLAEESACRPEAPEVLSRTARYARRRTATGRHPRGIAVAGPGLLVTERLEDAVAVLGDDLGVVARTKLPGPASDDAPRRGDRVFHDARATFQQAFSCRSCHADAHTDGLTYDFEIDGVGRDVVLNRSLRGVAGTEPFKWTGLNPTLERQCGPRFARVLTRADPFPEDRLADLTAYIESLPPPPPSPGAGRFAESATGAVERGRLLFERTHRRDGTEIPVGNRCGTCHAGPHFTNRQRTDVGTRGPTDSTGSFDVPHLTGIASKAPYLHDGRALSLEEIWTLPGVGDSHGVVTDLGKPDLNDLVEYLRGL